MKKSKSKYLTLIGSLTIILLKQVTLKRNRLRKQFSIKTSVRLSILLLTEHLMGLSLKGKKVQQRFCVT